MKGRLGCYLMAFAVLATVTHCGGRNRHKLFDSRGKATKADDHRRGKLFPLFNIVSFKNDVCTAASDNSMTGTCYTTTECNDQGGTKDGNCASGFGVCCIFITSCSTSGGTNTINKNCTYIQNAEYPSSSAANTAITCTYNVDTGSSTNDICQIRFDFDNLVSSGPSTTTNTIGRCDTDTVTATSPISTTANAASPPVICGTLTGQHMYVETGNQGGTGATLSIALGALTTGGSHKIKVSMIECSNTNRAPAGCVQYFTGTSGNIMSYNYLGGKLIHDQFYTNCIRQETGYCAFEVRESGATTPDPFSIGGTTSVVVDCLPDDGWIAIPNDHYYLAATNVLTTSGPMRCGGVLASHLGATANTVPGTVVSQMNTPFTIQVFTLQNTDTTTAASDVLGTGFSLDYSQVPCP